MAKPDVPDRGSAPERASPEAAVVAGRSIFALLNELRRRRVIRALVVYGAIAFAVLQVIEPVMHGLHLPEGVLSAVVVLLGLGFPVTVGLAWAFDLTATGLERTPPSAGDGASGRLRGARLAGVLLGLGLVVGAPGIVYHFTLGAGARRAQGPPAGESPLLDARYQQLTDFDGIEQAAAISRDGKFVAFQSDRDGRMDVWVTQVGSGQFFNLTRGGAPELVNPSIRALGFSPDGALVTFWARGLQGAERPDIGIWATPLLGGPSHPYLEGVAEFDWSRDGSRLVFHTAGPGDPMLVSDTGRLAEARQIYSAPVGLHGHFLVWSPDQVFVYFVQGALPDHLDLWRIPAGGGTPERITHHDSMVSHPVFLDARTLLYLATDRYGAGPWIYSLDVERRATRRVSFGVDGYTSLAASDDGRRVVATRASPKGTLWRVPLSGGRAEASAARRIPLTTRSGSSPRLGPGYLLYVSSKGASDSLWKLQGEAPTELWTAPETRIVGAPAIRRDGQRIAFSIRQGGQTLLYAVNADGTGARVLARTLELVGAPAWAPDGQALTVAAVVNGTPRLVRVPVEGGSPEPLLGEYSVDPAWSPDGDLMAFSGADVGATFQVKVVKAGASASQRPAMTLTRGARHLAFMPHRRALLTLRGEIRHKDLWLVDLETGVEQQVTNLPQAFDVRDFDVSPDGQEIVLEQVQERSDVVLIELAVQAP
jgi:Tol biopolymer transport system component